MPNIRLCPEIQYLQESCRTYRNKSPDAVQSRPRGALCGGPAAGCFSQRYVPLLFLMCRPAELVLYLKYLGT